MDFGFSGKTYVITGGSGGIGLAVSRMLLQQGANVAVHFNSNQSAVKKLGQELNSSTNLYGVQANLTKEIEIIQMFEEVQGKFGRIDGLVNNAGIWPAEDIPIDRMSLDHFNTTLQTNLTSYFLCSREFIRQLKKSEDKYASIVFIGSTAGIYGEANHIDYSVSKAALHGMMLSLKNELPVIRRYGRVNTVSPGWVQTPMAKEGLEDLKAVTKVMQTIALRKIASANDVASVVCFLLSDKLSGHVTGQNIAVTGGMEGRLLYQPDQVNPEKPLGD